MKVALAQINTTVGDFSGNLQLILEYVRRAGKLGAQLVVFPELTLTGYPPKDLLDRPDFIASNLRALEDLRKKIHGTACIVGFVDRRKSGEGKPLANAAALIHEKKILGVEHKILLPTYDVFDEGRYFQPGDCSPVFTFSQTRVGISLCEDIWNDRSYWGSQPYELDPVSEQAKAGAELLINLSASPYSQGKENTRQQLLRRQVLKYRKPLIYVNLVGGNDDLVFDGASMVFDQEGRVLAQLKSFQEDLRVLDLSKAKPVPVKSQTSDSLVLEALILGLQDYMRKCGFKKVVLGISGGIDSALVAWIASAALGPKNVLGVSLPSPYSSPGSLKDAHKLAQALGIEYRVIPISDLYRQFQQTLHWPEGGKVDLAKQNLQARIRGNLLMALSNHEGRLLLSTGNKSEMSLGYCTLYGDMAGGLAILSDVPKTLVYKIARLANQRKKAIPKASFTKPPSAELAPDQKDQNDLPPYEILDQILARYIEGKENPAQIVRAGFPKKVVLDILRRLDANEYKRRQDPPGIRVTSRAFGYGWRVPIANRYRAKF